MKTAAAPAAAPDLGAVQAAIERFLKASREPALLEPGDPLLELSGGNCSLTRKGSRLVLQAWTDTRNLTRRVTAVTEQRPGRLELAVERFAHKPGRLWLIDRARPQSKALERHGGQLVFREQFRRFLSRQLTGRTLAAISAEADLEHSLSPAYPRAFLRLGQQGMAAIAAPPASDASSALGFGLIWLDYLRRRERRAAIQGLILYLPAGQEPATCHRLRLLDLPAQVFVYQPGQEHASPRDPADYTNLDTRLDPLCRPPGNPLAERIAALHPVERIEMVDGSLSLRIHGLEFARTRGAELLTGLDSRAPLRDVAAAAPLVHDLARMRSSPDGPLHTRQPEAWLEAQVRGSLETIDPTLRRSPVYSQAPACVGGARGIIDLLAVDAAGRLVVVEIKASADLHLPLQALDYWMRVRHHLDRGDFTSGGYFPGIQLRPDAPRLLLVSPALEFHPTTETLLGSFAKGIEVERVGVNSTWRDGIRVMFRVRGDARP